MKQLTPIQVSKAIKHDLKKRGLQMKELSSKLNITPQWMTRILSGEEYISSQWAEILADTLGYNEEFLTSGLGFLQKKSSDFNVLCELIRHYIDVEEKEHYKNERWNSIKDSQYASLEEKKQTLQELRAIKTELNCLKNRIEIIINNR